MLKYEDGYTPEEPFLELHRLKTSEKLKSLIGKTIKDVKYPEGYCVILIIFTDGSELEVSGDDCFDFTAEIMEK